MRSAEIHQKRRTCFRQCARKVVGSPPNDVVEGRCRGSQCCRKVLDIAKTHAEALSSKSTFANGDSTTPTSEAWALYLQAHCLEWLGQLDEAMGVIDRAIEHTPTAVDFPEKKARLLKKAGRIQAAAEMMDTARKLDLADRYINNKAHASMLPRVDAIDR